jgi:hypothetical protein
MAAALSADDKFLTLTVVNATDSEQKFSVELSGVRLTGIATIWQMTSKELEAPTTSVSRRRSK